MANKISEYRSIVGISQAKFAEECGWNHPSRIANYELDRREPCIDDIKVIIQTFNRLGASCSFEDVFPSNEKVT